tara:strand:+ start:438 stop:692 length:255 start_codon:yes stop_codon:yes gene_type:complete
MSEIAKKIKIIVDEIQAIMESNGHLDKDPEEIQRLLSLFEQISLYWAHLNDEDNDYVSCAKQAFEEQTPWGNADKSNEDDSFLK